MIEKTKHFFLGGLISGAIIGLGSLIKNPYIIAVGGLLAGYLSSMGARTVYLRLVRLWRKNG